MDAGDMELEDIEKSDTANNMSSTSTRHVPPSHQKNRRKGECHQQPITWCHKPRSFLMVFIGVLAAVVVMATVVYINDGIFSRHLYSDSSTEVAIGFEILLDQGYALELFNSGNVYFHQLAIEICNNVSNIFNETSDYQGCIVTKIRMIAGVEVNFVIVMIHPHDTNTSLIEKNVTTILTESRPLLISIMSNSSFHLKDVYTDTYHVAQYLATIHMQAKDHCLENLCLTNSSSCVSGLDTYLCVCDTGHYGEHCELETAECDRLHCNGGGECVYSMSDELLCECGKDFEGESCEIDMRDIIYPCANMSAPCNNHGLCLDRNVTSYRCLCEAGYTGTDCEIDIDDCAGSPCFNGDCVDKVNGYLCECPAGFEGIRCQTNIDDCTDTSCGQNGTCYDLIDGFICSCDPGFTGSDCHSVCDDSPCFNNGTCSLCPNGYCEDTKLSFSCKCPGVIYGLLCTNKRFPNNVD